MQEIEQQLALYRLLVEKSLGLMCIHDLNGVLLATNSATARSLGFRADEGPGRNLRDFLVPSVRPLFDEYLQRIRANGSDSGLMRLLAKDGTERIWSYRNIRYDERGLPPCVLGHALDVTLQVAAERELAKAHDELSLRVAERTAELRAEIEQRLRVEEELLRARKLESIGVLAGGIAHDFNNFLTVVQGNIALALLDVKPGDPVSAILEQTALACRRAALLASQLLTFSKGGAPVRRVGSLTGTLRDAMGLAQAGSQVAIELSVAGDLRPVEFDAGQIGQVLHNVLLNARQSMPDGGSVNVRAENAASIGKAGGGRPVPLLSAGEYVRITVRDHGCGISPEALPAIFDPYFTTKEFGSGLGLATAYAIVKRHEGHIGVESQPGVGTTVSIYLPASCQSPVDTAPQLEILCMGSGRILVMDDEESVCRLLHAALLRLGFEAVSARNGAEAVRLFEAAKASGREFAAAILDLTVPGGMGGKEVAGRLIKMDPEARVILSSGYSNDSTIAEYRKHGFCDVLLKPWTTAQLSEVLRRAGATLSKPAAAAL